MSKRELLQEYVALKEIHHKALHELADAAQIIRSYEFLSKRHRKQSELFEKVLNSADTLCNAGSLDDFVTRRNELRQAIREFKTAKL